MGEFRIGRKHAQHTYPDSPGRGAFLFARNYAIGPNGDLTLTDKLFHPIVWNFIDSTGTTGANVPITPQVSGIIVVTGMLGVVRNNDTANPASLLLAVDVSSIGPHPQTNPVAIVSMDASAEGNIVGVESIPFQVELSGLPPNVTSNIQFQVQAGSVLSTPNVTIVNLNSTINIKEVQRSTG